MMVAIAGMVLGAMTLTGIVYFIAAATKKRGHPMKGGMDLEAAGALRRIEERIDRIEQGVEAVAVEVERIAEGQRFTTKLLSERAAEREPRSLDR
jgi:hypothetical protein